MCMLVSSTPARHRMRWRAGNADRRLERHSPLMVVIVISQQQQAESRYFVLASCINSTMYRRLFDAFPQPPDRHGHSSVMAECNVRRWLGCWRPRRRCASASSINTRRCSRQVGNSPSGPHTGRYPLKSQRRIETTAIAYTPHHVAKSGVLFPLFPKGAPVTHICRTSGSVCRLRRTCILSN